MKTDSIMVNIAKILKDVPSGTKLYSPMCGDCVLLLLSDNEDSPARIKVWVSEAGCALTFNEDGRYIDNEGAECMLFPSKENRDWLAFKVKKVFHKGDFVYRKLDNGTEWISIQDRVVDDDERGDIFTFADVMLNGKHKGVNQPSWPLCFSSEVVEDRLATEEEKNLLLKKIDEIGYVWNENTLEINPKEFYRFKAFDKVLVRDSDDAIWVGSLFSFVDNQSPFKFICVNGNGFKQCIPYEGNECLLGTTDNP